MDEKAGILIRVSTTRQGERGVSVKTQREDCSDYAERQGWQVVMVEEDHQTGTNFERAGFRRLVDAAKNGVINKLIVYSLDRFGRGDMLSSLVELGTFEDAGCEIHSLKDGGRQEDSLIRDIRLAINKDFSRQLSDKTTRNMTYLAQKGHWVSCPPFGYATIGCPCGKGKILDPDKDSWAVPEIFTRFLGGDSMREIVLWAASHGLKTRRGTPISHWSLSRILTNPAYVGLVVWNRKGQGAFRSKGQRPESEIITSPGKHKPLVAMDLYPL